MFHSPLREIRFVMRELLDSSGLEQNYSDSGYSAELADNILEEAGKFAENVLEPINQEGDRAGSRWTGSAVTSCPCSTSETASLTTRRPSHRGMPD